MPEGRRMTTVDITATLNYHLPKAADVLLAVEAIPMDDQRLVTDLLKVKGDCSPLKTIEGMDGLGRRTWLHATGRIDISYTATVAIDVCTRPCDSVRGTRCTRWGPASNLSREYAPWPFTAKVISLNPPASLAEVFIGSIFQPCVSA